MANQIPLYAVGQFVDPKTGQLSNEGRTIINALINRTGGPNGGVIVFATGEVYGTLFGPISRAAFNTNPPLPIGAAYSQAEVQALRAQVQALSQLVGALVTDLQTSGAISS